MFGNVLVQTKNRNNLFQYPFSSTNPLDNKQASKQPQISIRKSHSPMGKYFSNSKYLTAMVGKNSNKVNDKEKKKKRKRKGNLQKIESA